MFLSLKNCHCFQGRLKGSMVSVCEGNVVAVTKPSNSTPLFYGSCHHTQVQEIRLVGRPIRAF